MPWWQTITLKPNLNDDSVHWRMYKLPGPRPMNDISTKFKIRPAFEVLWLKMYSTEHNEILHMSRQCNLSWYVQNFIVICWACFKLEHSKSLSNFEFNQHAINGMGTRFQWLNPYGHLHHYDYKHQSYNCPSISEATLKDMNRCITWIYEVMIILSQLNPSITKEYAYFMGCIAYVLCWHIYY